MIFDVCFTPKLYKYPFKNRVRNSFIFIISDTGFTPKLFKYLFKTEFGNRSFSWFSITGAAARRFKTLTATRCSCLRAQAARSDTLLRIHREDYFRIKFWAILYIVLVRNRFRMNDVRTRFWAIRYSRIPPLRGEYVKECPSARPARGDRVPGLTVRLTFKSRFWTDS